MTSRNEYNAFGELSTANLNNLPSNNSIGYTGQRLDNETGLMALGNGERYYSPNYARFIQQDSWLGSSSMPQSLNRFSYAYNNPNKFTDPSGNIADDNRGSLANSARNYGLDPNGDNTAWNVAKNWAARTGYDLWDTISLGTLSRQEETVAQVENGEITQEQFEKQTGWNAALGFAKVGLMIATAGAGNALMAGAGLATRIGIGAGLGVAEQFGNDALEMIAGFRKDFSSAGTYALSAFTGGLFGAASPGRAATTYAKESKMTLGTELKFLKAETKELGRGTKQIGKGFGEGFIGYKSPKNTFRASSPEGVVAEEVIERTIAGVKNASKSLKDSPVEAFEFGKYKDLRNRWIKNQQGKEGYKKGEEGYLEMQGFPIKLENKGANSYFLE